MKERNLPFSGSTRANVPCQSSAEKNLGLGPAHLEESAHDIERMRRVDTSRAYTTRQARLRNRTPRPLPTAVPRSIGSYGIRQPRFLASCTSASRVASTVERLQRFPILDRRKGKIHAVLVTAAPVPANS